MMPLCAMRLLAVHPVLLAQVSAPGAAEGGASTPAILVAVILGLALLAIIAWRFLEAPAEPWDIEGEPEDLARWKKQRGRLLRSIKDLEVGHTSGAIADAEYQALRQDRMGRVIEVTRRLDRARRARLRALLEKGVTSRQSRVRQVEAEVRRRLKLLTSPGGAQPDGGSR